MRIDSDTIEALLIAKDYFNGDLSLKKAESRMANLNDKILAQRHALGLSPAAGDYSSNIGKGALIDNGTLKPFNPFGANVTTDGSSLPGTPNGKAIWDFCLAQGFSVAGTAGIMGNLMQESGFNPQSHQHGGGPGRGIMQWTSTERWAELLTWASKNKKDPLALQTQLEYMVIEMKNTRINGIPAYEYFKTVSDVRIATETFEKKLERAGTPEMEKRVKYAWDAFKKYAPALFGRG